MGKIKPDKIKGILDKEKRKIDSIAVSVSKIQRELIEKTPNKFCWRDVVRSFFGALVVAFGFVLKGALVRTAVNMQLANVISIIVVSLIILVIEIYYFGYRKIKDKQHRKLEQFILKRLPTFYLISIIVATGLVFLYGVNMDPLVTSALDVFKVIVAISLPASIGAGFGDLMKKY